MRLFTLMSAASFLGLGLVGGCASESDRTTPEAAFAGLAPCVDKADPGCLFEQLDRDSRWSVDTLHRSVAELRSLVEISYPEGARPGAYGSLAPLAFAKTAKECFAVYCEARGCMAEVAQGFAVVTSRADDGDRAVLETARGGRYPMARADGKWGLAMFADDLAAAKVRALDKLPEIRRNAKAFEEQRLAASGPRDTNASP